MRTARRSIPLAFSRTIWSQSIALPRIGASGGLLLVRLLLMTKPHTQNHQENEVAA